MLNLMIFPLDSGVENIVGSWKDVGKQHISFSHHVLKTNFSLVLH